MAQKSKASVKPDDPAEYERFLATAKEAEADKSAESFERAIEKVARHKKPLGDSA